MWKYKVKKGIFSSLIIIVFIMCLNGFGFAQETSGTCGTHCRWSFNEGVLTITGYGAMNNFAPAVPPEWRSNGLTNDIHSIVIAEGITSIGNDAFKGCSNLENINFPSSMVSLGENSFSLCDSLQRISFPAGLKTIGKWAFNGCSSLSDFNLPSGLVGIEYGAFMCCRSIKSISVPSSVRNIGDSAFGECDELESVSLPNGLLTLGEGAFSYCKKLKSITIPGSVTTLGDDLCKRCTNLQTAVLENGIKTIPDGLFTECTSLSSIIIPKSVTKIGDGFVYGCTSLEKLELPDNITEIGAIAFCFSGIKSIRIPEKMTIISYSAFGECRNLESIIIPAGIKTVKENAFDKCIALKDVYYCGTETMWNNINIQRGWNANGNDYLTSATIHYNYKRTDTKAEESLQDGSAGTFIIQGLGEFKLLGSSGCVSMIKGAKDVSTIVIPASVTYNGYTYKVTEIGKKAFYKNKMVREVVIGDNVESLGDYVFLGCEKLKKLTIGKNVRRIGKKAISKCKKLKKLIVKTNRLRKKNIGANAFRNSYAKMKVKVPANKRRKYKKWFTACGLSSKSIFQ